MIRELKYAMTHSPYGAVARYRNTLNVTCDKKSLVRNMKKSLYKYGICYEEYMLYGLYNKPSDECEKYIGEIARYKYYKKYNHKSEKKMLRNKALQRECFKEFYKNDCLLVEKHTPFESFSEFLLFYSKAVIKPRNKSCGYGVELLHYTNNDTLKEVYLRLKKSHKTFLCEEVIAQSRQMERFNATSLNTVRFVSQPHDFSHFAFSPFFRMGRYGKVVDNAGSGGIFASIDQKTGVVTSAGRDENGFFYPNHPDSKEKIKGFQMPDWEDALELVERLQSKVKSKLVSWDIAHTDKGWVLVEANYAGQLICQQCCY